MKQKILYTFGLITLGIVTFVASPAGAQTTAPGPYYATPSWDQKLQCDTPATCPRFIVLSNWSSNAVLDRETGLVWQRSPDTITVNWFNAQDYCNTLYLGERFGWRLPTIQELASLLMNWNPTTASWLPAGHPFTNVQMVYYWSATPSQSDSNKAWAVAPLGPVPINIEGITKDVPLCHWCVRGGQGADPQ